MTRFVPLLCALAGISGCSAGARAPSQDEDVAQIRAVAARMESAIANCDPKELLAASSPIDFAEYAGHVPTSADEEKAKAEMCKGSKDRTLTLLALKMAKNANPVIAMNGVQASIDLPNSGLEAAHADKIGFVKIDGRWYIKQN